jgi:hypothetical protein
MFLKRWYSFKRDWRMWFLMIIPSIIISVFLMLGFKREYIPHEAMELTNQLMNSSSSPLSFG